MSKTFDLTTLNLSAGTHEITVKARASGYADSPASNAVSYVVEGDTVQVSGTWVFNEIPTTCKYGCSVKFISNGVSWYGIKGMNDGYTDLGYKNSEGVGDIWLFDIVYVSPINDPENYGWTNQAYRTITFDGTQTVSKEFYEWLVANATRPISGTWVFNETPTFIGQTVRNVKVQFTSFGGSYRTIYTYYSTSGPFMNYRDTDAGIDKRAYTEGEGWRDQSYRTIAFVGTQYVSQDYYEWFTSNAVRQTISFTIENAHDYDTTTYYADVGMTWAEWCDSEYNTRGGYIFNNTVMVWCYPTTEEYNSGLKDVVPTDVISNGGAYVATTDGPCRT